jgi:AcrR family transcriptional regulator
MRAPRSRLGPGAARPRRRAYHHGDLPRAMVEAAVRTIQAEGVAALTLRGVGATLGVSRTALYRHFADKRALLDAVAAEGFRTLKTALDAAWAGARPGPRRLDPMGLAYVRFALEHPSHYRVMFSGEGAGPVQDESGAQAFQVLVDAIAAQQAAGHFVRDEPQALALYIWSVVHGVAMLALDGRLPPDVEALDLAALANERIRSGILA